MAETTALFDDAGERTAFLFEAARGTRGFMPDDEGAALYAAALRAGQAEVPGAMPATFVEIGAWCGKSTVYLGAAAEATGAVVLSIDHHRGSEENQPGWEYHEPDLVDPDAGQIDTLANWRRTMSETALEASVVGIVGDSPTMAARWGRPLGGLSWLGTPRCPRRVAGHSRRLSRPGRWRAPAVRALLRRARLGRIRGRRRLWQSARAPESTRRELAAGTRIVGGSAPRRGVAAVWFSQVQRSR
jgi:hypothetical protein